MIQFPLVARLTLPLLLHDKRTNSGDRSRDVRRLVTLGYKCDATERLAARHCDIVVAIGSGIFPSCN